MTHDQQAALEAANAVVREAKTLATYINMLARSSVELPRVMVVQSDRLMNTIQAAEKIK
jgi:hypothetical protein